MSTGLLASALPSPRVAIGPLIALVPAVLCMIDVARHPDTRNLTPQAWLAVCAFGVASCGAGAAASASAPASAKSAATRRRRVRWTMVYSRR